MNLQIQHIKDYTAVNGKLFNKITLSYQIYGKELHTAPIAIVNHALTGNSDVMSENKGWWKEIVGENKLIDTKNYTVIAFNVPGNGYDGNLIDNYKDLSTKDIALLFQMALSELNIKKVYAIIGGSLGGGVAWEMACSFPKIADYIIPIASNYQSSDWIIAINHIQESILLNSKKPIEDARKMAMLFYRTPSSFAKKFNRTKLEDGSIFNVESWLNHHANSLKNRYKAKAYLLMNHLLSSINVVSKEATTEEILSKIESTIVQISVSSDLLFIPEENLKTKKILDFLQIDNQYHEINSIDGHDAFLIEHKQITNFLTPIFNQQ